jgi:putative DNA primase/helicase
MSELLKRRLCYTPAWGWLAWDGKRWQRDNGRARIAALQELTNWIARAATQETNADKRKELFQAGARIQNRARLDNALAIAQGWLLEPTECFDQQAHLLNTANGVVDLRTGELLPHDPLLRLTQITTQPYDSAADCPGFRAFLSEIFANNDRLIAYLQRLLGYGLLGHNHERLFVIFWGRGHNGKTTLINILAGILGDYVHEARPESFETLRPGEVRARNDLAKLYNARIVTMNESRESSRLDPALVKQVTGGDPVTARFLYREDFTFRPMFLPILRTNFKPHLPGGDPALWDRMRLVPFTVHIPPERRVKGLAEHLVQREGTGILAWLVRGCLEYHRAGLNDPPEVLKATEEYRGETDPIWAFVQERCVISESAREEVGKLYQAYTLWCDEQGIEPKSKQAFGRTLSNLGFESRRGDLRLRIGIQLK